jgi:protein-histidine pros-kinase
MISDFNLLLSNESPDAAVITSSDGKILHWNKGAEDILGYTSQESVGSYIFDLIIPPDSLDEEKRIIQETITVGQTTTECLRRRKDGSLVYVDITRKTVFSANSNEVLVLSTKKDVTQLRVQRDAKLMEARFRDLLESTPDGIVMVNPTGHIVFVNSHAEHLFGYSHGELRGRPVEILLPKRLRDSHIGHRSKFFSQPRARSMGAGLELFGLRKDATEFPVEISLSPLLMEETSLVMSAIRDISERRKAEQKFKDLLESAPDAIIIMDQSGKIILVNSQTEKLFGYARAELLNQKIEMLLPERYRDKHPDNRNRFFSDPKVRPMGVGLELFGRRNDGTEFPVEISLSPLETEEGTLVSSAIRDITERKRFEKALLEKNIELAAANLAKDQFLASMSHELRTPLNSIIGFTGTLLMKLPGPLNADQENQLRTVKASAGHLLALINDLLDVAKIEAGKLEMSLTPIDCRKSLQDVAASLTPQAQAKGLALTIDVPEFPTMASADPRALHQIIINLVGNAIKFTEHGRIHLRVTTQSSADLASVAISVEDTGPGIPIDAQPVLFSAFARIHQPGQPKREGSGLGLYLSQKLAEAMGATLEFGDEYKEGSKFTLSLPVP